MPRLMLPLTAQPLSMPTNVLAAGPWEIVCAPVRLSSTAASVSFATIPPQYLMFRLRCQIVNDANTKSVQVRLNNDSSANYAYQVLYSASSTVTIGRSSNQTKIIVAGEGAVLAASQFATIDITIARTIDTKGAVLIANASYNTLPVVEHHAAMHNYAAGGALINRIDILASSNNFAANSIFVLEGSRF